MKAKYSTKDSRGAVNVACVECNRGHNGDKSCSAGARHKRFNGYGCFSGQLIEGLEVQDG